jgi:acetyl esterase/lipase
MSILFLVRLKVLGLALFAKLAAGALSPYWAVMGAAGAVFGWVYQAPWAIPMGIVGAGMMTWYVWRCTRDHKGFEDAFGAGWSDRIRPEQARHMVQRRWSPFLKLKASPEPAWERDIPFWTIPDTERELLCDVWRPANGEASGLAIVYCHSSGWFAGDKDFGTRPFFHHLVAQGHTVMDVAYVAWMRASGSRYGVDPRKIALGGGSAGAHLALLAGYTPQHPELTPEDVKGADVSVCGILSNYGPTDLAAGYEPWRASNPFANLPPVPIGEQLAPNMRMRYAGRMDILLGGQHLISVREQRPER